MKKMLLMGLAALLMFSTACASADDKKPKVLLETSLGKIVLELDAEKAPVSTKNFLGYVDSGHYDGLIFHRVIGNFMVQGGGFTPDMVS